MDNFGSEIGQKMRSAVKAKLLELGTGGSTGYIDDELPDYVMIMVANKRSKQQMTSDLNLFLGNQTELFVTWLHEVLQKLQEVTLPAASAPKKRKTHHTTTVNVGKKDKKVTRKDKKALRKSSEQNVHSPDSERPTTTSDGGVSVPVINSITDVFAEELLEKAKKTLDLTTNMKDEIKKQKSRKSFSDAAATTAPDEQHQTNAEEFDIPTISEISSTTGNNGSHNKDIVVSGSREKDLVELAEIQKKIYAAKKHLRHIGELAADEESEDGDFLNLKDDEEASEEYEEINCDVEKAQQSSPKKPKSPIIFERQEVIVERVEEKIIETPQPRVRDKTPMRVISPPTLQQPQRQSREREREQRPQRRQHEDYGNRRSVHERLGLKPAAPTQTQSRERRQPRQEKELYVPAHRRKESDNERERDRDRERERVRPRERQNVDKSREREHEHNKRNEGTSRRRSATSDERQPQQRRSPSEETDLSVKRRRIGSRVIVATKIAEPSDDDDINDKPVNSIIKIKPRPPVSPSRQASKNLLMRAVADAQRSTILAKTQEKQQQSSKLNMKARIGPKETESGKDRSTTLYTQSYRDRLSRGVGELFRRTTQNLVVEVKGSAKHMSHHRMRLEERIQIDSDEEMQEEHLPEVSSDGNELETGYVYVSHEIRRASVELDDIAELETDAVNEARKTESKNTQFVVTLHDDKMLDAKYKQKRTTRARSSSPLPQVSSSSSCAVQNGALAEASSTTTSTLQTTNNHNNNTSSSSSSRSSRHSRRQADYKSRLATKQTKSHERESSPSSPTSNTPPPSRAIKRIEILRHSKEIKKIIIKNDSDEDEETSPKKTNITTTTPAVQKQRHGTKRRSIEDSVHKTSSHGHETRSTTPPLPLPMSPIKRRSSGAGVGAEEKRQATSSSSGTGAIAGSGSVVATSTTSPYKNKRTPIRFDLSREKRIEQRSPSAKLRDDSEERETRTSRGFSAERRKISIRNAEARKYDNIPSLSSVAVDSGSTKVVKPKERCKYHPNCTKQFCEFYHPTAPCKSFPNCKYADKCMYSHPKCKFDLACMSVDCNFSHSGPRNLSHAPLTAPPLSSHVVPVQNYKSISAAISTSSAGASATMCKYYPNCTKAGCTFYHPKLCRFGKNCINKLECNFYHHEVQSSNKFKWVASMA